MQVVGASEGIHINLKCILTFVAFEHFYLVAYALGKRFGSFFWRFVAEP